MAETMTAVVCHGPGDYRVEEVPVPTIGPGELLLQIPAAGICASDIKCFLGGPLFWGDETRPAYVEAPVIAGHEFAGRVVAAGEGALDRHGVRLGDRVIPEQIIPCNACRFCKRGQYWMCQVHDIFGFKGKRADGGWAPYLRVPANAIVHRIPDTVSDQQAAYIEPLACAIHAVERGEIQLGDVVAIGGVGNIGLCMLQAARLRGPGCLIALDTRDYRLDIARQLGADVCINVTAEDALARVRQLTDGYGVDVYIEVSGHPSGVVQGLQMMRKLGTMVEFSVFTQPTTVDWTIIGDTKELNIHGSHLGPYCYPKAIDALARRTIVVDPLIGASYPLREFPAAMEAARSGDILKTLLVP